jgi:hypothetical protein
MAKPKPSFVAYVDESGAGVAVTVQKGWQPAPRPAA